MRQDTNLRPRHPEKIKKPDNISPQKPSWIRVKAPTSPIYETTKQLMRDLKLVTVCEEASCPNIGECWQKKHATMMIMGEICTRACSFCNVTTGLPRKLDKDEPIKVAEAVKNGKSGQIQFRTDKSGIVHCSVGKAEFSADKLKSNIRALVEGLNKAKPASSKGVYLKKVALSTTMGPGVRVEPSSLV
mgnify:CR=1 FL=1